MNNCTNCGKKIEPGVECSCKLKFNIRIEAVNHPEHYNKHPSGIECIDIVRHHNFNIGSAIKYLWRCGLKENNPEIQELKKAVWYIQDEIKNLEKDLTKEKNEL